MTTTDPLKGFGTITTPQSRPVPGRPEQIKNAAGGYGFELDPLARVRRFLTMGTAGGTYYVGQNELTAECGNLVIAMTQHEPDHRRLVDTIVEFSLEGRAPKQNPTLFALAIACQMGTTPGKQYARQQITKVVRTGTHLFIFVGYLKQFGGWSRGLRKAVGNWYVEKDADELAYQLVKYRQREGYTHRDILRLTHPKIEDPIKRTVIDFAVRGNDLDGSGERTYLPAAINGYVRVQSGENVPQVLESVKLPWEALPDSAMNDTEVWDKLLDNGVPVGALLRQLPRLTQLGMLPQIGGRTNEVVDVLTNMSVLKKARIHPIQALVALKTYSSGYSIRGSSSWSPTTKIIDALDEMFYRSFGAVEDTGKRTMLACDISYSMQSAVGGFPLSAAEVAAAMSLVTMGTESNAMVAGFSSMSGHNSREPRDSKLIDLNISSRQRLDDVMRSMYDRNRPFGGTDCALPMLTAMRLDWCIDTFVIYTDNETWHGEVHPFQALKQYRKHSGIDARLIVVGVTATNFTVADPSDSGMLDISGFDSAAPQLISDFSSTVI